MWYEFPQDVHTFDLDYQFMFGSNILVAPKIGEPRPHMAHLGGTTPVEVYLPPNEEWYDFYSKYSMPHVDGFQRVHVADEEQGTFVRCGTVLPLLNMPEDERRLSLLQAIDDPVRLEVYPCHNQQDGPHAIGTLYLDDGESHHHSKHDERTRVHYVYDGNTVSVMKILKDNHIYTAAATKVIDEISIYGVHKEPKSVVNRFAMIAPQQGMVEVDWVYIASSREIHVTNLHIPVDEGLFYGKEVALLEIIHG